jgi:hypothetical protein
VVVHLRAGSVAVQLSEAQQCRTLYTRSDVVSE